LLFLAFFNFLFHFPCDPRESNKAGDSFFPELLVSVVFSMHLSVSLVINITTISIHSRHNSVGVMTGHRQTTRRRILAIFHGHRREKPQILQNIAPLSD
jgi:hypothetical protein